MSMFTLAISSLWVSEWVSEWVKSLSHVWLCLNQSKLEVVKQEMARVNIDILGISELKWTRMGEPNSDAIISTTVGKNPLEEME